MLNTAGNTASGSGTSNSASTSAGSASTTAKPATTSTDDPLNVTRKLIKFDATFPKQFLTNE